MKSKKGFGNPVIISIVIIFWALVLVAFTLLDISVIKSSTGDPYGDLKEESRGVDSLWNILTWKVDYEATGIPIWSSILLDAIFFISVAAIILG